MFTSLLALRHFPLLYSGICVTSEFPAEKAGVQITKLCKHGAIFQTHPRFWSCNLMPFQSQRYHYVC